MAMMSTDTLSVMCKHGFFADDVKIISLPNRLSYRVLLGYDIEMRDLVQDRYVTQALVKIRDTLLKNAGMLDRLEHHRRKVTGVYPRGLRNKRRMRMLRGSI